MHKNKARQSPGFILYQQKKSWNNICTLKQNFFMKRILYSFMMIASLSVVACKGKKDDKAADTSASTEATTPKSSDAIANQPKNYKVVITPDSALLGKKSEALVKATGGTAVALQDPDGKDNGIELNVKLQLTNKGKIGDGSSISVSYSDSRLQLDNGNNITAETGTDYLRAAPEATSKEESWTYKIPAGAKPAALNLFLDGTRVSVKVALED